MQCYGVAGLVESVERLHHTVLPATNTVKADMLDCTALYTPDDGSRLTETIFFFLCPLFIVLISNGGNVSKADSPSIFKWKGSTRLDASSHVTWRQKHSRIPKRRIPFKEQEEEEEEEEEEVEEEEVEEEEVEEEEEEVEEE